MEAMNIDALRVELVRDILDIDNLDVLKNLKRTLERALAKSQQINKVEEDEVEYISKAEILNGIREGLTEYYTAKKEGKVLPLAEDLLDEL